MKKILLIAAILILLAVFCFSGWQVYKIWKEYRVGEMTYEAMDAYVKIPEPTVPVQTQKSEKPEEMVEPETQQQYALYDVVWPEVDFDALRQINPDVVGWLYIEGTKVNYPVLQGEDNDQYLYRMIDGKRNGAGSLFLDAAVAPDFSAQNNPIYGHNMKSGSMLAGITGYKKQDFFEEHPVALLMTPEQNYQILIFSACVESTGADAWDTEFTEQTMQTWLDQRTVKSYISTGLIPTTRDKIVTLSTCTYETKNSRFLVHGILVPDENAVKNTADQ